MAKIQDVDIPHLEFAEGAAPGTPASAIVRIYAKSDGLLYSKDDAGAETLMSGGGGANPQFTTIELGHASDTTLARVSAGVVSIEGTNIVKAGAATGSGLTMATARLLGRTTASTGAIEEITVGSGLSLSAGSLTATGGSGGPGDYILLQDQRSSGTSGGTATSGSWETRTLQTEVSDAGGHCSLASNQFTLAAGTYRLRAWATGHYVDTFQARVQNVTDATTVGVGSTEIAAQAPDGQSYSLKSLVEARFTIAGSKAFELQFRVTTTKATNGWGVPASFGTEVYASVELVKEP